jgi:hypothetical protein
MPAPGAVLLCLGSRAAGSALGERNSGRGQSRPATVSTVGETPFPYTRERDRAWPPRRRIGARRVSVGSRRRSARRPQSAFQLLFSRADADLECERQHFHRAPLRACRRRSAHRRSGRGHAARFADEPARPAPLSAHRRAVPQTRLRSVSVTPSAAQIARSLWTGWRRDMLSKAISAGVHSWPDAMLRRGGKRGLRDEPSAERSRQQVLPGAACHRHRRPCRTPLDREGESIITNSRAREANGAPSFPLPFSPRSGGPPLFHAIIDGLKVRRRPTTTMRRDCHAVADLRP